MARSDDAALVLAIRDGDVARFSEIVARFDRSVRRFVARRIDDPDTREELVQQTFYLAFKRLGTLRRPEQLQGWLLAIARNNVAGFHRRQARRGTVPLPEVEAAPPRASWVWDEVAALPHAQAQVLRLRYRDGCSYEEAARHLGVPLSTIRGRIYQARRALRRRLEKE